MQNLKKVYMYTVLKWEKTITSVEIETYIYVAGRKSVPLTGCRMPADVHPHGPERTKSVVKVLAVPFGDRPPESMFLRTKAKVDRLAP